MKKSNEDSEAVASFGREWSRFDQTALDGAEQRKMFKEKFGVFPWSDLPPPAVGAVRDVD